MVRGGHAHGDAELVPPARRTRCQGCGWGRPWAEPGQAPTDTPRVGAVTCVPVAPLGSARPAVPRVPGMVCVPSPECSTLLSPLCARRYLCCDTQADLREWFATFLHVQVGWQRTLVAGWQLQRGLGLAGALWGSHESLNSSIMVWRRGPWVEERSPGVQESSLGGGEVLG